MRLFYVDNACICISLCYYNYMQLREVEMGAKPSKAVQNAMLYFTLHPQTKAPDLAKLFGVNEATIYRATWYKNRAQPQTGEK